jgi:hypothetical protein
MRFFLRSRALARTLFLCALPLALVVAPAAGCGGNEGYGLIGGEKVDASLIDRDPLALLPRGVLVLGSLDAAAMFQSKWGPEAAQLVQTLLPLGPESNFVPSRDVVRVVSGVYAMQGADFCAVVQGTFDLPAIQRAVDARAITIDGAPLVKTRYAGTDLYTAGNLGFSLVTSHTVLSGNETGMRRALDRLRFGKLERVVPKWMLELAETKGATMAIAGDLGAPDAVDVTSAKVPFLGSVHAMRVVGNFLPPGMNFAGTLSYADAAGATSAAQSLQQAQQVAKLASMFTSIGWGASIPTPEIAVKQNDVAFTVKVDDNFVHLLLKHFGDQARAATTSTRTAPR